jgi:F-type H+-transporting ATPase subunit b
MVVADAGILGANLTLVVQVIIFLVTAWVLWKLVWGRVVRTLEDRQKTIEGGLRAAEESEKRLAQVTDEVQRILDDARSQAREIITRAHQEATADADEVRNRGRRDAEAEAQKALADIAAERDRAVQELRAQVAAMVVEAAGRIIGQSIDERTHQRLIEESLEKVTAG